MEVWITTGLLMVLVVCYVHHEIPRFTHGVMKREVAHAVLIVTGCAFGTVIALIPGSSAPGWAAFVMAFGLVHVPAALILLIKYWRGSGQS